MKKRHLPAAFALVALSAALLLCSCDKEECNPPYIAVTSGAFFYSPQIDLNKLTVEANTDWQVFWTPAIDGVVVSPMAGSGEATIIVENMPVGATIQIGVSHGCRSDRIKSNTVRVARGPQSDL